MIILASASPRRRELLKMIFNDFEVIPADIDEDIHENCDMERYPELLAIKKARHIAQQEAISGDDIVIGCDTGVFIDGEMLGKPHDEREAAEMLTRLSGKTHKVITGCCVIGKGREIGFSEVTEVEFYSLSKKEIDDYINTGEPMDKAGSYGIQGQGALLVSRICGDFYNVVGLPVSRLKREIEKI